MTALQGLVVRIDAKRCHVEVEGTLHLLTPRGKLFEDKGQGEEPDRGRRSCPRRPRRGGTAGRSRRSCPRSEQARARQCRRRHSRAGARRERGPGAHRLGDRGPTVPAAHRRSHPRGCRAGRHAGARSCINKLDLEGHPQAEEERSPRCGWSRARAERGSCGRRSTKSLGYAVHLCSVAETRSVSTSCARALRGPHHRVQRPFGRRQVLAPQRDRAGPRPARRFKISGRHREGRHTTTHSSLLRLAIGGHVVDTPGIRNFGLFDLAPRELPAPLPRNATPFSISCGFADCSHTHEPDCAVLAAKERGEIAAARYDAYRELLAELG